MVILLSGKKYYLHILVGQVFDLFKVIQDVKTSILVVVIRSGLTGYKRESMLNQLSLFNIPPGCFPVCDVYGRDNGGNAGGPVILGNEVILI